MKRLINLKNKMRRNDDFLRDYREFMEKLFTKGYAERVPDSEIGRDDSRAWFIPHHGVYHPHKPNKIRVVFDCTAMHQGVFLNSLLLQGPDMTNSLMGVLLRFRQETTAIMGDIESMFYQVRVPKEDRDFLRFYWWENGDLNSDPVEYHMCVHLFGAMSSPSCSTAALRQTAEDNRLMFDPDVSEVVAKSFYVDDCLKSVDSDQKAISLISDVSALCAKGGFHVNKWVSSSPTVVDSIPVSERAGSVKTFDLKCDELPVERALGVLWSVWKDCFEFDIHVKTKPPTRRGILSVMSSVYDPLGIAAPYVLEAKVLLQRLCKENYGWDQEVGDKDQKTWQGWIDGLFRLQSIELPRCYKPVDFGPVTECQLHMFSDACEHGYGVVAYLRLVNDRDDVHVSFVMGKSRVAPLKRVTIPRMELTAATLAVKLSKVISEELEYELSDTTFWTDSMAVLRYIANDTTRFHTFVANRVGMIREATSSEQWNFVAGKSNPADACSRGLNAEKFLKCDLWFKGPEFLGKLEKEWPERLCKETVHTLMPDDPEVKRSANAADEMKPSCEPIDKLIEYYSDWRRLKRAVAWFLLFIEWLRKPKKSRKMEEKRLTLEILDKAENVLVRHVQNIHFHEDSEMLKEGQCVKPNSALRKLEPMLCDGILGRLDKADIPFSVKHPMILPRQSTVTDLILRDCHEKVGHLGKNAMLADLRQRFWILGANSRIKTLVSKCAQCRRYRASSLQQQMSDLLLDRLTPDEPPFSHVGMDFFGPIIIKRGRKEVKRYGVIFTCLSIRAIHLEVAASLDTSSCINAMRRFVARRGPVKTIRSDNGTNLVGAERELREEICRWNQDKIHSECQQRGAVWQFNPPSASHHGGVWERMIWMVRKVLYALLRQQTIHMDDEGLSTLFCEVESIVNNRPITAVPSDPNDLCVLTPNDLLLLRPGETMPPGLFDKADKYTVRRWRQVQYLANIFWKRWVKEYLPLLQFRQKWTKLKRNVQIGDIVLLIDNMPRNLWNLGRVIEVFRDRKGFVRTVQVKTKSTTLVRPITKLCMILESECS